MYITYTVVGRLGAEYITYKVVGRLGAEYITSHNCVRNVLRT
jgi:hypothetical protein